ncbi:MAG TPA: ankyrin repeat domain-containing protein, partial [Casimicrobiaceae bacterium]
LLHENAGIRGRNWGPPMSYAANLGRDEIIILLHSLDARDVEHAIGRAALQGKIEAARLLHRLSGARQIADGERGGPAYTINAAGTRLLLELGARLRDDDGKSLAPIDVVLQSDSRHSVDKHEILEMYAARGVELPDTPTMALHRGRIDLLEAHLARDPQLLRRTFAHEEIFPPAVGCGEVDPATQGTPLAGATLLHIAIDFDDAEIVAWLLDRGADVNARAAIDAAGFGGHTALFSTVVSQPAFWMNFRQQAPRANYAKLLLEGGAEPNVRATLRKAVSNGRGPRVLREYRDVTPLSWGERFDDQ